AAPRVADPELFLPGTTSAEALTDATLASGAWRLQAELGLAGRWQLERRAVTVARGTLAGALALAPYFDAAASVVTRAFVAGNDPSERFVHMIALGGVAHARGWDVAARLELPIDSSARVDHRFLFAIEARGR